MRRPDGAYNGLRRAVRAYPQAVAMSGGLAATAGRRFRPLSGETPMKKLAALFTAAAVLSGCVAVPYDRPPPPRPAPGYGDRDRDGVPNRYDRDRDGDGVPNRYDRRPNDSWRN